MRVLAVTFSMLALLCTTVKASPGQRVPEPAASAIRLASVTYGVSEAEMVAVARCETGGTFNPRALNRVSGAAGLMQFLPSTFEHTPYRRFSIFNPYANALAAAWLYVQDGRSWKEWQCQPR